MNATEISLPPVPQTRPVPGRIQPASLAALLKHGNPLRLVDVRSHAEYRAQHVAGSVLQPLDSLNPSEWADKNGSGPLYIFCHSGGRANRAAVLLTEKGVPCSVVEGGLEAWIAAGLPTEKGTSPGLPLMRQVQLVIGLVSGTGATLAVLKHPLFALIPLFMSLGLIFAAVTGYCGLALLMARMPWNRGPGNSSGKETPTAKTGSCCAPEGDHK